MGAGGGMESWEQRRGNALSSSLQRGRGPQRAGAAQEEGWEEGRQPGCCGHSCPSAFRHLT